MKGIRGVKRKREKKRENWGDEGKKADIEPQKTREGKKEKSERRRNKEKRKPKDEKRVVWCGESGAKKQNVCCQEKRKRQRREKKTKTKRRGKRG